MQLGSMFISNCNNNLHVSDAFCLHPHKHLKTVVTASYTQYDLVRKPSTMDALTGYFTPSHVIHQRIIINIYNEPT